MSDKDETNLLLNCKLIMEGIRKLNEDVSYKSSKIYNNIETSVSIINRVNPNQSITLNYEELKKYLSEYIKICDPNILEYKA